MKNITVTKRLLDWNKYVKTKMDTNWMKVSDISHLVVKYGATWTRKCLVHSWYGWSAVNCVYAAEVPGAGWDNFEPCIYQKRRASQWSYQIRTRVFILLIELQRVIDMFSSSG